MSSQLKIPFDCWIFPLNSTAHTLTAAHHLSSLSLQYYVLGREVSHHSLDAEGGRGTTYIIESGSYVKSRKNWRLISSFWAFDFPLRCTNKYTVYRRDDPFPRMCIALGDFTLYSSLFGHNTLTDYLKKTSCSVV